MGRRKFDYNRELDKARDTVKQLKNGIEALILGKRKSEWKCLCGANRYGESEVVRVKPLGRDYSYLVFDPIMWDVQMRELRVNGVGFDYTVGLSDFLPSEVIDSMFGEAFSNIDTERIEIEYFGRKRREGESMDECCKQFDDSLRELNLHICGYK